MDYDGFMAMFLQIKNIDHGVSKEFITPTPFIYIYIYDTICNWGTIWPWLLPTYYAQELYLSTPNR